jgi:hypothetical protein
VSVSVRDKRRLPFFIVTKAATKAIRDGIGGRRGQVALTIYVAVLECANDLRAEDCFEMPRKAIAARAMVTPDVLKEYLPELDRVHLIEATDQSLQGKPTRWTLLDPPEVEGEGSATPPGVSAAPTGGRGSAPTPLDSEGEGSAPPEGEGSAPTPLKGLKEGKKEKHPSPSGEDAFPEDKSPSSISPRRELIELSHRLADGIRLNDAKAPVKPDHSTWLEPLRLLVERDGRSIEEIGDVIDWVLADEFNRKTVLSPRTLRRRFPELAQKADVAQPGESTSGLKLGNFRRAKRTAPLEDCPTTPELVAAWEPIRAELRAAVDDSAFIWLAQLHLHNAGNELVLGCPAESKVWIRDRFGRLIEDVAEKSIVLVACGCDSGAVAA